MPKMVNTKRKMPMSLNGTSMPAMRMAMRTDMMNRRKAGMPMMGRMNPEAEKRGMVASEMRMAKANMVG